MNFRLKIALGLFFLGMVPAISAQAQQYVCQGEQVCLTVPAHRGGIQWQASPDSLNWSNMPGGSTDTLCFSAQSESYYRAVITEGSCAPVISSMSHVLVNAVFADAGADAQYCASANITIGGSPAGSGGAGPLSYLWTPATGLSSATVANPVLSLTGPATYVLQVTDSVGCTAMDTVNFDTSGSSAPPGTIVFTYTGGVQYFVVPACVDSITAIVEGAQGGANWVNNTNFGGKVEAKVAVTAGETLYVYVGGQPTSTAGGYNGGGAGDGAGRGGGGGSDIRQNGQTLADRILVGGGGGGAGYWSSTHVVGGAGGGLTGGNGYRDPSFVNNPGGKGATQTAGGADGTCINMNVTAMAGSFGQGGTPLGSGCGCEGYGGGGGWYGGAGSGNCRGGGGGSGYAIPSAANVVHTQGTRVGNGQVTISW